MVAAPTAVPGIRPASAQPISWKTIALRSRCAMSAVRTSAEARSGTGTNAGSMRARRGAAMSPRPNPHRSLDERRHRHDERAQHEVQAHA